MTTADLYFHNYIHHYITCCYNNDVDKIDTEFMFNLCFWGLFQKDHTDGKNDRKVSHASGWNRYDQAEIGINP